jgi:hypothetical protein
MAPEIRAAAWLNTQQALSLAELRGRVVALHVFQMLCEPPRILRRLLRLRMEPT